MGLLSILFGPRHYVCPHCHSPITIRHGFCRNCGQFVVEPDYVPIENYRQLKKLIKQDKQWNELRDRRLNKLVDEYVQNPRWEDIETIRATWERIDEEIDELNLMPGPTKMDHRYSYTITDKRKAKLFSKLPNANSTEKIRIENEIKKLNTLVAGHPAVRFIAQHAGKQTSTTREGQHKPSSKVDQEVEAMWNFAQRAKTAQRAKIMRQSTWWIRKERAKSTQKPVCTSKQSSTTKAYAPTTVQDGIRNALANLSKALQQHGGEELRRTSEEYLISVGSKRSLPEIERKIYLLEMKISDKVKRYLYWRELDALRQLKARIEKRK